MKESEENHQQATSINKQNIIESPRHEQPSYHETCFTACTPISISFKSSCIIYISNALYVVVFLYSFAWGDGGSSFCWYRWNCWRSLFKLSFHNIFLYVSLYICKFIYMHYIIQTSRSKWQPYNISVQLDLKVTLKDTRLILNIIYVWKLNQTVLELDFRAVKFLFFPRRDLNPHHWYTAAPFA